MTVGVPPHVSAAPHHAAAGLPSVRSSAGPQADDGAPWPADWYLDHQQPTHGGQRGEQRADRVQRDWAAWRRPVV